VHHDTEARFLHPALTTVRVFTEEIGKQQMAELVLRQVAEPGLPSEHFSVPTQLVKRQSCQLSSGWTDVRRQLLLSISDNYFSLSTTITSFLLGVISPRLG
jgi:hypothetical protein